MQWDVSIPRSGFCWFGPSCPFSPRDDYTVSIPRSGFCWFGLEQDKSASVSLGCFNPSVGILLVWTRYSPKLPECRRSFNPSVGILLVWTRQRRHTITPILRFQSLGRDSVGLDPSVPISAIAESNSFNPSVGILLVWTNACLFDCFPHNQVSIPRSGFCWFGPSIHSPKSVWSISFQSLGRDSVGLDLDSLGASGVILAGFNPSVGILLVWTIVTA